MTSDTKYPTVFAFELDQRLHQDQGSGTPVSAAHKADSESLLRIAKSMEAVGDATYHWIIESDEIHWSPNGAKVLECSAETIITGRAYASLLDGENITSRYDTVMRSHATDDGSGVPFQIEYVLRPQGRDSRRAIWVEDHGRWFADANGRPREVYGTIRRIDDRHSRDQHLSFLGNCDPLTGMMNRGRLSEALNETIAMANQEQISCAFLIAAVNNLSIVNEAYGFEVADEVIVAMGRRLRQVVRTGDAIARYSGSKFGIILNNCTDYDVTIAVNRFINLARESVIETEHGPVWAMLSIGAVVVPRHATDANLAMARAEEALTEARRLPSDGSVIYKPSVQRAAERSLNARCATEIVSCLKADHFKLAYQPIVSAQSHEVFMHEALLRMVDSHNELIAAAHLIPVAEKLGLVRLIDRAVAHMAIATLHNHPQAQLSMNVSGATATDPRWFQQLTDIIKANSEVASRLTVEITETVALGNMKEAFGFVETLRNIGCSVAIDDFGAGFTSFRNLRDLPVNIIKLDGTFCLDLANNPSNQYLIRTLVDLGHKFDLKVIAEWVESEADLQVLQSFQVDYLQGNLFGTASTSLPWPSVEHPEGTAFNAEDSLLFALSQPAEPHYHPLDIPPFEELGAEPPSQPAVAAAEVSAPVLYEPALSDFIEPGLPEQNLDLATYDNALEEGLAKLRETIKALNLSNTAEDMGTDFKQAS